MSPKAFAFVRRRAFLESLRFFLLDAESGVSSVLSSVDSISCNSRKQVWAAWTSTCVSLVGGPSERPSKYSDSRTRRWHCGEERNKPALDGNVSMIQDVRARAPSSFITASCNK